MDSTLGDLKGTSDDASDMLSDARTTLDKVSGKLRSAGAELASFNSTLSDALNSGDMGMVKEVLGNDPETLASTLAAPVQLRRKAVFPVANFGSSMAPFYTLLPLWVGALLMVDMAHTAGLIAAGLLENPVKYAHIVTSTTHKTLRGPRGGIILMGKDFENPWGQTTPKGVVKMMSQILNSAVFPGIQGGPLEHVIAAKAVAFGEALEPAYKEYQTQVQKNAAAMAAAFVERGYKIVSGGTDNHLMLVDLRTKFPELTGKLAEKCLVAADITTNKNMVPFDSRSPFQTSGLRFGTPAITTRGLKEDKMELIVELIDRVLHDPENEANIAAVRKEVNALMSQYPLFAW